MKKRPSKPKSTGKLIRLLESLRFSFAADYSRQKAEIVKTLVPKEILSPSLILKYHDALCFMQAYPDNREIKNIADQELSSFSDRVAFFRDINGPNDERIDDLGMVDTFIRYPYNFIMSRWLLKRYGNDIDVDWEYYAEDERDPISGLLNIFALYIENDGIDDEDLSTEEWVKNALGGNQTSLRWLLTKFEVLQGSFDIQQYLYDGAELMLKWYLGNSRAASTLAKAERPVIHYQKRPMKKRRFDLRHISKSRSPQLKLLTKKQGQRIIETQILALLPRHRELYPTLYANPSEVYVTSPGRGLEIYMIGMHPENRMPLETNYSGLIIKNGVPIGYAISVLLFDQCEIAINVFDLFRSGEASVIFNQFFKVYYHHFGARAFLMRKWQVGHENEEGLQSGSFWFYYKLGFRSIIPEVEDLARKEASKIKTNKSYRSDLRTLKRLALSDLLVNLRSGSEEPFRELRAADIGMAVTRMIASDFGCDSQKALRSAGKFVISSLGITDYRRWSKNERQQFERLAPLLAVIKDLPEWSKKDKKILLRIIKSRAAIREKGFVQLMQRHKRLKDSLTAISKSNDSV
jgi:hypothetical protein